MPPVFLGEVRATGALIDLVLQLADMEIYTSLVAGMLAGGGYRLVTGRALEQITVNLVG